MKRTVFTSIIMFILVMSFVSCGWKVEIVDPREPEESESELLISEEEKTEEEFKNSGQENFEPEETKEPETEEPEEENSAQFDISDNRTLDEVVKWLLDLGYVPSFCTACYREGRTGDRFMSLCKSGQIQNCCHPNALMTLKEYLTDYASPETKAIGDKLIEKDYIHYDREDLFLLISNKLNTKI